jgi:hypothetical protein
LKWADNDQQLTYYLLETVMQNEDLRKGLWPGKHEKISQDKKGITKIKHLENLAVLLLQDNPELGKHVTTDKGRKHYARMMKNRVYTMTTTFKDAIRDLGCTGGGTRNEEDLDNPESLDNWEDVQAKCPWYLEMRAIVGDRFDDVLEAITNGGEEVDIDLMRGSRKKSKAAANPVDASDIEVSSKDGEADEDPVSDHSIAISEDDDTFNLADLDIDQVAIGLRTKKHKDNSTTDDDTDPEWSKILAPSPRRANVSALVSRSGQNAPGTTHKAKTPRRSAEPSPTVPATAPPTRTNTPRPGSTNKKRRGGQQVDLIENFRMTAEKKSEHSRDLKLAQEETRRYEIAQNLKFEREKLRLNLELEKQRMAIEERRVALAEYKEGLGTGG